MSRQLNAKFGTPNPEVFLVYLQDRTGVAACLTQEREAYDLADLIDGTVDHIPLFKSLEAAKQNSNIEYEIDRVASEPSRYPEHVVYVHQRDTNERPRKVQDNATARRG